MRFIKNKKALSPVVTAIILIAVTVAVSIAAAIWLGALTLTFNMKSETYGLEVTEAKFPAPNLISLTIKNNGTGSLELTAIFINDQLQEITQPRINDKSELYPISLNAGSTVRMNVTYEWKPEYNYQFKFVVHCRDGYHSYYIDIRAL